MRPEPSAGTARLVNHSKDSRDLANRGEMHHATVSITL
jgi:hypothetical protein